MNIVYLVFGNNKDNYRQVYFSILTAMVWKADEDRIIVLAEDPSLFQYFGDRIEVISIDKNRITEWEGQYRFFWRVKIKALELIAKKFPDKSILYLDGDTFFYKDMTPLRDGLKNGQNFMHLEEGKLASLNSKTEKLMWKQMQGKTYGAATIDRYSSMWNAGLIGISQKHFACLQSTLDINDAMCAGGVTRRLIEQFAFSLGLSHFGGLQPADQIVGHYWGNKSHWNKLINSFLEDCFMKNFCPEHAVEQVKMMNLTQHAIWVKESNTQRKLKNFIDNFYKNKKTKYILK